MESGREGRGVEIWKISRRLVDQLPNNCFIIHDNEKVTGIRKELSR